MTKSENPLCAEQFCLLLTKSLSKPKFFAPIEFDPLRLLIVPINGSRWVLKNHIRDVIIRQSFSPMSNIFPVYPELSSVNGSKLKGGFESDFSPLDGCPVNEGGCCGVVYWVSTSMENRISYAGGQLIRKSVRLAAEVGCAWNEHLGVLLLKLVGLYSSNSLALRLGCAVGELGA